MIYSEPICRAAGLIVESMNVSCEDGFRFLHTMGELLIAKNKSNENMATIICIPDEGKLYNDSEKMVGRLLAKEGHRVFCFDFDEIRDGKIKNPKSSADKTKCVRNCETVRFC